MKQTQNGQLIRVRIRKFISSYRRDWGYSPSIREIGEAMGGMRPSVVAYHLDRLEKAGEIKRRPGLPRTVIVLPSQASPRAEFESSPNKEKN